MKFSLGVILCFITIAMFNLFLSCAERSEEKGTTKVVVTNGSVHKKYSNNSKTGNIYIKFVGNTKFDSVLKTKLNQNTGRMNYFIFYDKFENDSYEFKEIAKNKYATYRTQSEWVMIRRYFSFFEFQDFLVHKGDSLIMDLDYKEPIIVKYSVFSYKTDDFNIESIINAKYPGAYLTIGRTDDTRMVAFKYFFDDPGEIKRQHARNGFQKGLYLKNLENKMGKDLLPLSQALKENGQQVLDSLHNRKRISDIVYDFYKQKYSNLLLKLKIISNSIDTSEAAYVLNKSYQEFSFPNIYFINCLDHFEKKYIASKAKWTVCNQYNLKDPKESFIIAKNVTFLNSPVKDQLLFISLNKIDLYFPEETKEYFKIFAKSVADTNIIRLATAKYLKDELISKIPSDLYLLTLDRKQTTIEQLLKEKKGKVIYIDFWASWCAPCIEEMKHSKNLLRVYGKQNLEVLFLSLDDNYNKWIKSSERQEINLLMNNFKILNANHSKFVKEHKLISIPRYMIVDKNGKFVNTNSKRPSDSKIKEVLNKLMY